MGKHWVDRQEGTAVQQEYSLVGSIDQGRPPLEAQQDLVGCQFHSQGAVDQSLKNTHKNSEKIY